MNLKKLISIVIIVLLVVGGYAIYQWSFQPTINDRCQLEPITGPCKARFSRYYFNQEKRSCEEFIWGGCENKVPFETLTECQQTCKN